MDTAFARFCRFVPRFVLTLVVATGLIVIAGAFWGMHEVEQHKLIKTAPPPVEG